MKKLILQSVSLLLIASMLVMMAAACTEKETGSLDDATTSSDSAQGAEIDEYGREIIASAIPAGLGYDQEEIVIICRENAGWEDEIGVEDSNGDVVNDSIYRRNLEVEEILDITIKTEKVMGDGVAVANRVTVAVNSYDDVYDLVAGYAYHTADRGLIGEYVNLLGGLCDYIDFAKPWWSSDYYNKAEINDKLFFCVGALSLSSIKGIYATYVNTRLAADWNKPNLSEEVLANRWTYDKLLEVTKDMYDDTNGNSIRDDDDIYGFGTTTGTNLDPFSVCFGQETVVKSSDGELVLNFYNEKMVDVFDKMMYLIYNHNGTMLYSSRDFDLFAGQYAKGNVMIAFNKIMESSSAFRDMEDNYMILPFPKYDEYQENYLSYCHDDYSIFGIPVSAKSPSMSSAVLELMNELSYKYVLPSYYEIALKNKYSRDNVTSQMLDIIYDGLVFDIGWIYSKLMSDFMNRLFRDLAVNQNSNFTSSYYAMETVLNNNIKTIYEEIERIS